MSRSKDYAILRSTLYISKSQIVFSELEHRASSIVNFSKSWNAAVGITGALVFTEYHFVQFIEGPAAAVADLLAKLRLDRRHTDMNVIEEAQPLQRQFGKWSLAYSGPDTYIDRELIPLLQSQSVRSRPDTARQLKALLQSMADNQ
ncbi:BLUF domain-containing protein [Sphingomonas natans]|uniref:BLUF domain-containing protein n=1 Tax=Sphingomonas natans TaxID=3063330 RepID=UPI003D66B82A